MVYTSTDSDKRMQQSGLRESVTVTMWTFFDLCRT